MRIASITIVAASCNMMLLLAANSAHAVERIPLRDAIIVHDHVVTLSDLLPLNVPEPIRLNARQIALGESPLPGERRVLKRDFVLRTLDAAPSMGNSFEIPAVIEVTRWSRLLTREDVFNAIHEALLSNTISSADSLTAEDITFSTPVTVTEQTPTLKVLRIEPVPSGAGMRIRLWTVSEPRVPPFWVCLDRDIGQVRSESAEMSGLRRNTASHPVRKPDHTAGARMVANVDASERQRIGRQEPTIADRLTGALDSSPLARAGAPIDLVLQGPNMHITTTAIPLEPGRAGQKIRVRAVLTGKILSATVIAANRVEIDY